MRSNFHEKSEYYWEQCNDNVIEITSNYKVYRHHKCAGKITTVWPVDFWKNGTLPKVTYHQVIMWFAFDEPMPS